MFTIPAQHATGAIAPGQTVNRPVPTLRKPEGTLARYLHDLDAQQRVNDFIRKSDETHAKQFAAA